MFSFHLGSSPFAERTGSTGRCFAVAVAAWVLVTARGAAADPGTPVVVAPDAPQGWEEVAARRKADLAADLLTSTLMRELTAALEDGGPAAAVEVCRTTAQRVTEELSRREGITVRRTSLRLRNPVNRPDEFERTWLEEAQVTIAGGGAPVPVYRVVRNDGLCELRHLRPIWFPGGLCSQCHGRAEEIDPKVKRVLRRHYPDDQATGFAPGDLRGAISVRVAVREPCAGSSGSPPR